MSCIYGPRQRAPRTRDGSRISSCARSPAGDQHLRRWLPGAGHPVRRRCGRCLCAAWRSIDRVRGTGLQSRRRPGECGQPAAGDAIAIEELLGQPRRARIRDWRAGDQRYYVSDTRRVRAALGVAAPRILAATACSALSLAGSHRRETALHPAEAGVMRVALVNPPWSFEGSIYFGCREPHLPLELGYARALLERGGQQVADAGCASLRPADRRAVALGRGVPARHDGGHNGAELPVLALRAAGTARAARIPRGARRRGRPQGGGRAAWLGDAAGDACGSSASMSWCAANARRSSCSSRDAAELAARSGRSPTATRRRDPRDRRAACGALRRLCRRCTGRTHGSARHHHHHHRFDCDADGARRRGRGVARLPLPLLLLRQDRFPRRLSAAALAPLLEEIDGLVAAGRRLPLFHRRDLPAATRRCWRRWSGAACSSASRRGSICGSRRCSTCSAQAGCVSIEAGSKA